MRVNPRTTPPAMPPVFAQIGQPRLTLRGEDDAIVFYSRVEMSALQSMFYDHPTTFGLIAFAAAFWLLVYAATHIKVERRNRSRQDAGRDDPVCRSGLPRLQPVEDMTADHVHLC